MTLAEKTLPASPLSRAITRAVVSAVMVAVIASALSPLAALAVGPNPRLLQRMKQDAVLAERVRQHLKTARLKGVDAPTYVTRGPLPPRVLSRSSGSSPDVSALSPLRSFMTDSVAKWLVLLVDFNDKPAVTPATDFDRLVFGDVTGPSSVRGYYREVSAGQLDIQPVAEDRPSARGWIRMQKNYSYYVDRDYGTDGPYPRNSIGMFEDACSAAEAAGVDFSQYDNNHDGFVDGVILIHAGSGAEFSGSPNDVWSHCWSSSAGMKFDGVTIGEYVAVPEYWAASGDMTTGVYVHELGHNFGLPDLYDIDGSSQGLGSWSLMAGGEWNGPRNLGGSPARFDAWCLSQLTLVKTVEATHAVNDFTIYAADEATEGTVIRVEREAGITGKEYFLLENRQKRGTDSYLAGAGLLVYHVDETQSSNENESRYLVGLEEAHGGTQHLRHPYNARINPDDGDSGDPFPGSWNQREFSDTTDPNAHYYDGLASNIKIDSISSNSATMTARVIPDITWASTDFTAPTSSSDAVASYPGTATITISASDGLGGSGVKTIHWTLDGVAGTGGTVVTSVFGSHHLEFWAEDNAGHLETPHPVDFTVGDLNPPRVTTNAASSYSAVAVTVTVTASDTPAGSGVASLSYQLDGGSVVTTTDAAIDVPIAGASAPHQLVYWAIDAEGNESAHTTKTITLNSKTIITITSGNPTIWAGVTFWVRGRIDPLSPTTPVSTQKLRLERYAGGVWLPVAYASLQADYTFAFSQRPTANTTYRVVAWSGLLPGSSYPRYARAYVKAVLGTPSVPTGIKRYVTFTAKGSVTPHNIGWVTVRWYKYSASGARYAYGSAKTVSVSSAGSWYLRKKLPKGRYAVRVTHGDASHAYSSSSYRTFSVK